MASTWGLFWGASWGSSWGSIEPAFLPSPSNGLHQAVNTGGFLGRDRHLAEGNADMPALQRGSFGEDGYLRRDRHQAGGNMTESTRQRGSNGGGGFFYKRRPN